MAWVPISAWLAALVVALVVLGYCAFEIVWKARRLRADLARLRAVAADLVTVKARLLETQDRLAAAGLR